MARDLLVGDTDIRIECSADQRPIHAKDIEHGGPVVGDEMCPRLHWTRVRLNPAHSRTPLGMRLSVLICTDTGPTSRQPSSAADSEMTTLPARLDEGCVVQLGIEIRRVHCDKVRSLGICGPAIDSSVWKSSWRSTFPGDVNRVHLSFEYGRARPVNEILKPSFESACKLHRVDCMKSIE